MTQKKKTGTRKAPAGHTSHHEESFWSKYVFSTNHFVIALQYTITGVFMALIGGYMAYVFRMQLAFPGEAVPGFGIVGSYMSMRYGLKVIRPEVGCIFINGASG